MPDITFARPAEISAGLAAEIRIIYEASFPPEEQGDFKQVVAEIRSGKRVLLVAYAAQQLAAFAILYTIGPAIEFLSYFAVAAEFRSQGIGGLLFRHAAAAYRAEGRAAGIVFEVESPNSADPAHRALSERRIEFYRRNGAILLDDKDAYTMPSYTGNGVLPMKLMWLPLNTQAATVSAQQISEMVVCLYRNVYERPPDDPLLAAILRELAESREPRGDVMTPLSRRRRDI